MITSAVDEAMNENVVNSLYKKPIISVKSRNSSQKELVLWTLFISKPIGLTSGRAAIRSCQPTDDLVP